MVLATARPRKNGFGPPKAPAQMTAWFTGAPKVVARRLER